MNDSNNIYNIISGSNSQDSEKNSKISAYLLDLLYKDYHEIASTHKRLLSDDKKLRDNLHKFVIDSAPIALKNINCCTNTSETVKNLSKTALDISKATNSCTLKAKECASSITDVVGQLGKLNKEYGDYKFVNSLVSYLNEFELSRDEDKLSHLLSFNEVLKSSSEAVDTKLGSFLSERVKRMLRSKECELFNSFNNDPEHTTKIIELIKKIGFSNTEQISVGFLKNRLKYMKECFQTSIEIAKTDLNRGLQEALNGLKNIHSISSCYKSVFGDVDTYLSTFTNRVYQEFFDTVAYILKDSNKDELGSLNLKDFDIQITDLLGSLAPLGLSFITLTNFSFNSFLQDVVSS